MINWKNLEKFIAPGKVVTLVLLVDGEEVGAFSFNVDSLAFKEALEAASHLDPVKVAEKKSEPVKSTKKAEPAKKVEKSEPEPMDEEENEDDGDDVDQVYEEAKEKFAPTLEKLADKPMTREQIMAQDSKEPTNEEREQYEKEKQPDYSPQRGSVSSGPAKETEKKPEENKNQLKLTDEW